MNFIGGQHADGRGLSNLSLAVKITFMARFEAIVLTGWYRVVVSKNVLRCVVTIGRIFSRFCLVDPGLVPGKLLNLFYLPSVNVQDYFMVPVT